MNIPVKYILLSCMIVLYDHLNVNSFCHFIGNETLLKCLAAEQIIARHKKAIKSALLEEKILNIVRLGGASYANDNVGGYNAPRQVIRRGYQTSD